MTTLDQFIAQQASKPRFQQVVALNHRCDYGHCESRATRLAVTALVDAHGIGTGLNEVRGVCERHLSLVPTSTEVA